MNLSREPQYTWFARELRQTHGRIAAEGVTNRGADKLVLRDTLQGKRYRGVRPRASHLRGVKDGKTHA